MFKLSDIKVIDNSAERITDMPKLHSPFKREENENEEYVVTDEINNGYEWVFEDNNVKAIEKLDGTNVSVIIEDGHINAVFNRKNRIPAFNKGKGFITKGILNSIERNYLDLKDGQWFGELIGPKVNGNPYGLEKHLWIPFKRYSEKHLEYKSWGKYPKTFEAISKWFKSDLIPLFYSKYHNLDFDEAEKKGFVEGIVFTHPDGRMAKLRKDMFDWYKESRHKR